VDDVSGSLVSSKTNILKEFFFFFFFFFFLERLAIREFPCVNDRRGPERRIGGGLRNLWNPVCWMIYRSA
jgi:hypothetical protein